MSRAFLMGAFALTLLAQPSTGRAQTPDIPDEPPPPPSQEKVKKDEPVQRTGVRRETRGTETRGASDTQSTRATETKTEAKGETNVERAAETNRGASRASASERGAARAISSDVRISSTPLGESGLVRVAAADATRPGVMRLSFGLDLFSVGTFITPDDGHSRVGGQLSIAASPIDYVEVWLSTRAQSNDNARTNPQLLQSQGDLRLGIKGFYPIIDTVTLGADLQLGLLSGIGRTSFDFSSSEVTLRALSTFDMTKAAEPLPIRAHLNAGMILDNSHNLIGSSPLSNAERFALGISDFNRFALGVGVEVPVKYVTPFLEYSVEFPFGYYATPGVIIGASALRAQATGADIPVSVCTPTNDEGCARPAVQRVLPQRITPGVRITALPSLTLDLAIEIGLTPAIATGVLAVPPYNVIMLATYAFDPFREERGPPIAVPVLVPEVTEVQAKATTGEVAGKVHIKGGAEIAGAVITFDRGSPVATAANGAFRSLQLEPGPIDVTVQKDGYETKTAKAEVTAGGSVSVDVELVPSVREGTIKGRVIDDKDKPLANIKVTVDGPTKTTATTGPDGTFEVKAIAGAYSVDAAADPFLNKGRDLELKGGETSSFDLVLRRRPKEAIAEISNDMIIVKQTVHFVTGEARLAPDASAVLDAVVDVLVRNKRVKKIRIEGHTDNVGVDEANLKLSKDRAQAVVDYLVQQGIDAGRLSSEGYGASRPIAPNLTRRGREQNRRVEFHIVE